jgi:hypothetical protein
MKPSKKLNGSTMFYSFTYALEPVVMELWAVPPVEQEAYYSMVMVDPVCLYQAVPLAGERQILKENRQQNIDISQIEIRQRTVREPKTFKLQTKHNTLTRRPRFSCHCSRCRRCCGCRWFASAWWGRGSTRS